MDYYKILISKRCNVSDIYDFWNHKILFNYMYILCTSISLTCKTNIWYCIFILVLLPKYNLQPPIKNIKNKCMCFLGKRTHTTIKIWTLINKRNKSRHSKNHQRLKISKIQIKNMIFILFYFLSLWRPPSIGLRSWNVTASQGMQK